MPPKARALKARMCMLSDGIYNNDGAVFPYYPDAPSFPPLTPVKPRATPYVIEPDQCTINFRTGTIQCINTESHGGLYPRPVVGVVGSGGVGGGMGAVGPVPVPVAQPGGPMFPRGPFLPPQPPLVNAFPPYPNYVYAGAAVMSEAPDSPLNRILQRSPAGPWKIVGAAIAQHADQTAPRDRTMLVYAQMVDSGRDRYNYRVVDPNSVPLDIAEKVHWKNDGDPLAIPGYPGVYRLQLYNNYR